MNLKISQISLRWLPHLEVLQGQLWLILDEERGQDGPMLHVRDVVRAHERVQQHRHGLKSREKRDFYTSTSET